MKAKETKKQTWASKAKETGEPIWMLKMKPNTAPRVGGIRI